MLNILKDRTCVFICFNSFTTNRKQLAWLCSNLHLHSTSHHLHSTSTAHWLTCFIWFVLNYNPSASSWNWIQVLTPFMVRNVSAISNQCIYILSLPLYTGVFTVSGGVRHSYRCFRLLCYTYSCMYWTLYYNL